MKWMGVLVLVLTTGPALAAVSEAQCSPATYYCLSPQGAEFGVVGNVMMWHDPEEGNCIPSPHSHYDGCSYVAQLCNKAYPRICQNDCLAGRASSYTLEKSCEGVHPLSPDTTIPTPTQRQEWWRYPFNPRTSN